MLWSLIRAVGRHHRDGRARVPVRRLWGGPARARAAEMERSRPGWVVLYGPGSRRFFAMAAWSVPDPVMVSAPTVEVLEERMEAAEAALLPLLPNPVPAVASPERPRRRSRPPGARRTPAPTRGLPYSDEGMFLAGSAEGLPAGWGGSAA
ncbi:hypothetical protein GCM10017673_15800 [Streptosporangium violaceochromogenes]|nr:hypothetical protein GCM10017673_15800 [Streptosporangium violaceochromogenes]